MTLHGDQVLPLAHGGRLGITRQTILGTADALLEAQTEAIVGELRASAAVPMFGRQDPWLDEPPGHHRAL